MTATDPNVYRYEEWLAAKEASERAKAVCADFEPELPFTSEDAERESLDAAEPPLDNEELAEVVQIGSRCFCGRYLGLNPFGGKVQCPNCGAHVGRDT